MYLERPSYKCSYLEEDLLSCRHDIEKPREGGVADLDCAVNMLRIGNNSFGFVPVVTM